MGALNEASCFEVHNGGNYRHVVEEQGQMDLLLMRLNATNEGTPGGEGDGFGNFQDMVASRGN